MISQGYRRVRAKGSQIPEVHITPYSSQAGCVQLHADHILDSVGTGFIDLTYQHGYDNCQIGCLFFKNWKFRVYANCSVEYLGDTLYDYSHLGIAEHDEESLSLYPNPATDKLTLSTSIKNISIGIFDMTGREYFAPHSERTVDISDLAPGLYCLRAQDRATVIFRKFVKQ